MQVDNKQGVKLNAPGMKVGMVVARWNGEITEGLLASALLKLSECGVLQEDITTISVAGAVEIPFALQKLALEKKYDALVAIGCVIRGETPHFDYVCKTAQEGVLRVSLDHTIPIGFGVLTVENLKQAKDRIHVGGEAALAALELALLP